MNLLRILDSTPEPPIIELELNETNQSGDYYLGTPMYEYQKELTDQIISLHYPDILKFCETNDQKDIILKSVETCIENCMLVCTHPYLLISHYMPKNLAIKDMPAKLAETSGKFNVLKDLLNVIISNKKSNFKSVGLVMSNNLKLFDLIEALLMACSGNKTVKRYVGNNIQRESKKAVKNGNNSNGATPNGHGNKAKTPTQIHLIPTDGDIQRDKDVFDASKFDILITVDGNVDTETEFYQSLKTMNRSSDEKHAVTIRLSPFKTIEHIKLFYMNAVDEPDYLYKLISSVVCLRDFIGNIPPDIFPIYHQKLSYLGPNFLDQVFGDRVEAYPPWPLPALPLIQKYTPIDVERSLLTEAHFHYTPYGLQPFTEEKATPSYYETKRLTSDYITNPLKNSYNELIGITGASERQDTSILTHKSLLQLNAACRDLRRAEDELDSYNEYESDEIQNRIGRREKEKRLAVSKIFDDLDHSQQRIDSGNKWYSKKQEQIEQLKIASKEKEDQISNFHDKVASPEKKSYVGNQLKIWELERQIKQFIAKVQSKDDEKNFTNKEYENSVNAAKEAKQEQTLLKDKIEDTKRKYHEYEQDQETKRKEFKARQQTLADEIKSLESANEELEAKLGNGFRFLKDTAHLKKRKIRTSTPSK
ncbi:HDA3 [Candida margitis]|uniref:HDA3 n=1 Tax=Candida margitis TaxID=1775924 RepID=UPI00222643F1|nr:HDA3 [Candida margitis]KAI5970935.1 HDA3 [Candida margitis]